MLMKTMGFVWMGPASFSQISYSHYGLKLEAEADGIVSSLITVLRAVLGFLPNSAITI